MRTLGHTLQVGTELRAFVLRLQARPGRKAKTFSPAKRLEKNYHYINQVPGKQDNPLQRVKLNKERKEADTRGYGSFTRLTWRLVIPPDDPPDPTNPGPCHFQSCWNS